MRQAKVTVAISNRVFDALDAGVSEMKNEAKVVKKPCRTYSREFKARVVLAAVRGNKSLVELAQQFDVHPNEAKAWTLQLLKGAEILISAHRSLPVS